MYWNCSNNISHKPFTWKKNLTPGNKIEKKTSETELSTFYSSLKQSEEKLAVHGILPGFTDKFKPDAIQYENKLLKTKLYSEELVNLSFEDLPIKCNNIYETIKITQKYIVDQKNSYLYYKEDGNIFLKGNHSYFYQVQTQMLVTGLQFCDLFLWTNCDVYR